MIEWLDMCCPLREGSSWLSVGLSAITTQQQVTNFDCGVACLLYAEKCGQQQVSQVKCFVVIILFFFFFRSMLLLFVYCQFQGPRH